ncbi:MAG: IPT/TIG domain-containing protein, partial [Candidatus Dormiibacterota bacterium]
MAARPRRRLRARFGLRLVGRAAGASTFLVVGSLLLAGLVSQAPVSFANASAGVVQSFGSANTTAGTTLSKSPTAATAAGDLLVAVIRTRNTTAKAPVSSVTDSASNHWVRAATTTQGSQADGEIWYAASAAALTTAQSITVTLAASSAIAFTVVDITGATASPLDVIATKGGATQPASTGTTVATAQASEIAIGDIGWNSSTGTVSGQTSGYTVLPTQNATVSGEGASEQGAWQLLSATGAQSYSATLSSSTVAWTGVIATFKLGGSSAPTITAFSPASGAVGTIISIAGSGFTGATSVKFNGVAATTFVIKDDGHINATVPSGAANGSISVTVGASTGFSPTSFTLLSS